MLSRCPHAYGDHVSRTLILIRHAKSDWSVPAQDRDRPLTHRGLRQAPYVGEWLAARDLVPRYVAVSPARRAQQTWDLVLEALAAQGRDVEGIEVHTVEDAYTFSGDDLLDVVAGIPGDAPMAALVGHNPAMEELVEILTGQDVILKTSAMAVVETDGPGWTAGGCRLLVAGRPADESL